MQESTAKKLFLIFIRIYQQFISGLVAQLFLINSRCRFTPPCSEYMYHAVDKHGVIKGLYKGFRRIIKCRPFGDEGYDPLVKI